MYDIITAGSSTVDVFASTKTSELIRIMDSKGERDLLAYPTGSKILIEQLEFTTGGGATNTAVALARLGHKVACISKTGCGSNAEKVKRHLKREKIDTSLMVCDRKGRTGYSIILDSLNHDRTILAFKGSNNDLRFRELNLKKLNTRWFYFSTMMGESFKMLVKLAKFAEKKGIKIAFNCSQYLAEKGIRYSEEILKRTDIFVLNREEAALITKKDNMDDMLKELQKMAKTVIITEGNKETNAYDGKYIYTLKPNNIKVVETTGAGDAFACTFMSGMMKKNDIEFALRLANANAESVIQYHGAKNKLLTYKEALKAMKKRHSRVIKRALR
ncbi:carbohydrate kinase family protein [Candidatus Woesearchaeota archaeon]|nr:carbohydrate kinase family protein [Candidatus Woesearchaeota archaeon]